MDKQRRNIIIAVAVALVIVGSLIFWQNYRINVLKEEAKSARIEAESRAYQAEIEKRRIQMEATDKMYEYRDSLRQAYIDKKLTENKKKNEKIRKIIDFIPGSPDSFRDSLWSAEWLKQDGPIW
jgi:type VI protein secretion system component VasK